VFWDDEDLEYGLDLSAGHGLIIGLHSLGRSTAIARLIAMAWRQVGKAFENH